MRNFPQAGQENFPKFRRYLQFGKVDCPRRRRNPQNFEAIRFIRQASATEVSAAADCYHCDRNTAKTKTLVLSDDFGTKKNT